MGEKMVMSMAWRGIMARGWRAVLIVALLAASLAASTVVFSAADSFVFDRVPYPNADRIVVLQRIAAGREPSDYIQPGLIAEWRKHTDIFSAVHAHDFLAPAYFTAGNATESTRVQVVTPGLFEALGVPARWGRTLQPGDELPEREPVAVIAEELARRMFANPADVIGQLLPVGTDAPRIVGIMPKDFRFPSSRERIWRPLDLARQPHNENVQALFLRAVGVSQETLAQAVTERLPAVEQVLTLRPRKERTEPITLISGATSARSKLVFGMLMGAALSLLLIACANVAGLELAAAMSRARTFAIHTALGAPRAMLVRTALVEAGLLLGASTILAWLIASWGIGLLTASLPPAMINDLTNSIDLDARALAFMAGTALLTWLITSLPVIVRATRSDLIEIMKQDHRAIRSPATSVRQWLIAGQVALTVALLVGALLNVRTYAARLAMEKGFDSARLVGVQVVHTPSSPAKPEELDAMLLETLRTQPGITSVSRAGDLLPSTTSGISAPLSVVGRKPTTERIRLATSDVDPEYFRTVGIRILAGRSFTAADPPGMLVVD
jgi:putative ABC transport system permease protein